MHLVNLASRLELRLLRIDRSIDNTLLGGRPLERHERWALQEGYLSQKWQAWCGFCRAATFASCRGAIDGAGVVTTSTFSARSDLELAWIAKRAALSEPYTNVRALAGHHLEPTWGDIAKYGLVIGALNPSNASALSSGILASGVGARHLQVVRNATAHLSANSVTDVNALAASYIPHPIQAPSDAMLWEDRALKDFAYRAWTTRMIAGAKIAVS